MKNGHLEDVLPALSVL